VQRYQVGTKVCRARRVAWYDDARSVRAKVGLVRQYQLRGVAFWALGYEAPRTWAPLGRFGAANVVRSAVLTGRVAPTISFGEAGIVGATLRAGGVVVPGAPVSLQRRSATGRWRTVGRLTTNARGRVRTAVHPTRPSSYRFVTSRGWAHTSAATTSAVMHVHYAVAAQAATSRLVVGRGTKVRLWGLVQPASAGLTVQLQGWNDRRWVTRTSATTGDGGDFAVTIRLLHAGRHRLRFVVPSGALDRGASAPLAVRVS
jgi:hypothetical protein